MAALLVGRKTNVLTAVTVQRLHSIRMQIQSMEIGLRITASEWTNRLCSSPDESKLRVSARAPLASRRYYDERVCHEGICRNVRIWYMSPNPAHQAVRRLEGKESMIILNSYIESWARDQIRPSRRRVNRRTVNRRAVHRRKQPPSIIVKQRKSCSMTHFLFIIHQHRMRHIRSGVHQPLPPPPPESPYTPMCPSGTIPGL